MRRTVSLLFFLMLTLCPAILRGQSATQTPTQEPTQPASKNPWMRLANNGAWWNTLSPEAKSDFVDGYVTAMAYVHRMLMNLMEQYSKSLTPGPQFDGQMALMMQTSSLAERYEYEELGRDKLLAGVDTFYKEPLNKLMPIEFAFAWEKDTLNGKVAPRDLQKQLDKWRATVNK